MRRVPPQPQPRSAFGPGLRSLGLPHCVPISALSLTKPGPGTLTVPGVAGGRVHRAGSPAKGGNCPVFVSDTGCWASGWLGASPLRPAGTSGEFPGVQAAHSSCPLSQSSPGDCPQASPGASGKACAAEDPTSVPLLPPSPQCPPGSATELCCCHHYPALRVLGTRFPHPQRKTVTCGGSDQRSQRRPLRWNCPASLHTHTHT